MVGNLLFDPAGTCVTMSTAAGRFGGSRAITALRAP
jgi:hypothetical protein